MKTIPEYFMTDEKFTFCLRNFSRAKPFSSFLPGIAGINGIPMWVFYANRGQCISSFGTENKDGAILEFQPANRAYNLTGTRGFRTFIKWKRKSKSGFKEFFSSEQSETLMKIRPYEIEIEEKDPVSGFSVNITCFTVPGQPCAMLARIVTIRNNGTESAGIEMLDGLPNIVCFGMAESFLKNMSRTLEAWSYVENIDKNAPFFHIESLNEDRPDVIKVERGNFFLSFIEEKGKVKSCDTVVNPWSVFGMNTDLINPGKFAAGETMSSEPRLFENRTPCAMGHSEFSLESGSSKRIVSIYGNAANLAVLNGIAGRIRSPGFACRAREENRNMILGIADKAFVKSSSGTFDSYCGQNFMDNILRGGLPVTVESSKGRKKEVMHLYSRKHGDPERDYNSFLLMPTFYSQGNGGYRDINQNRRNDVYCNPDVFSTNIEYFMNLIQLDGYNPLVVKGVSYRFDLSEENRRFLRAMSENTEMFGEFFKNKFIPSDLIDFIKSNGMNPKTGLDEFVSEIIVRSTRTEEALHGEGYWIDHWFYNLDLLESFENIFPDRVSDIVMNLKLSFYDSCYFVVPRSEKYTMYGKKGPVQMGSVVMVQGKDKLIRSRKIEADKVRTDMGRGEIYQTSLLGKLLLLLVNKISSLDSNGVGVEMEAGKPSWNDALNGMPALFGSCVSETFEIRRLAEMMKKYVGFLEGEDDSIRIPVEACKFFNCVSRSLEKNLESGEMSDFEYWDAATSAREKFREETKFGIKGQEKNITKNALLLFLELCLVKSEKGIVKAFDRKSGLYNTYFMNIPEKYDVIGQEKTDGEKQVPKIAVKKFRQVPLPPFLEGQVHGLRNTDSNEKASLLFKSVRNSQLYDEKLGMYRVNASLARQPVEIGRIRAFTPGWLENESIFLHMEYKYLLELLRKGLYSEFFQEAKTALVPFMKPEVYGRSIFENSSFIASSANPDKSVHGNGFVARLSGSTSEFYNMLLIMALGEKPFRLDGKGKLELFLSPALPKWIFTGKDQKVRISNCGKNEEIGFEAGIFAFRCLNGTLFAYHNSSGKDVFGPDNISKIVMHGKGDPLEVKGNVIRSPLAGVVRDGRFRKIDIYIK
ncbi:MAG: hypothetical protein A2X45_03970 [Lentisphaerae bacterium GWF2_50_93]|nr:MAG: hypothetical protein A2X45_03970 [Lentisphaerae bacterium GWF2_50_93]